MDFNLNEEVRDGFLISSEMKKVWRIQLEMTEAILKICKNHGIRIWGASGTMLGAVRHKGFIPWDDDIDLYMFREDYAKLVDVAPKELESRFFFQVAYTEKGYYRGHSQVRCNNTTMMLPDELNHGYNFHQGIFIDIFVLDNVPDNEEQRCRLVIKAHELLNFLWDRHYPLRCIHPKYPLRSIKRLFHIGKIAFWSDIRVYSYIESLFRQVKRSEEVETMMFIPNTRYRRKVEWFNETIYVPFENIMMPIPKEYDKILKKEYGDYMTPIKGSSMHGNLIIDTAHNYDIYLNNSRKSFFLELIKCWANSLAKYIGLLPKSN